MVRAAHPAQVRACFLRSRDLPRRIDILGRAIFSDHVSLAFTCGNFSGRYPIRARGSDERTHKENWTQPGMAESSWRYTASTCAGLAAPETSSIAPGGRRAAGDLARFRRRIEACNGAAGAHHPRRHRLHRRCRSDAEIAVRMVESKLTRLLNDLLSQCGGCQRRRQSKRRTQ